MFERALRWALVFIAVLGLAAGGIAYAWHRGDLADLSFTLATVPVVVALAISILRDFLAGRLGVDAIALVSMSAAIALGQPLAGAVVALMYSGGNVLEDIAVASAAAGNLEIVEDGETGLLAAPESAAGFADRILRVCGDPELEQRLVRNARLKAAEKHGSRKHRDQVLEVYDLAVHHGRQSGRRSK